MDPRLAPDAFWPRLEAALARVEDEAKQPPEGGRVGSVLVLLEETPAGPQVVLTRRRADLRSHPGQLSFAGGRLDEGETIEEAALREAEEEIGIDADSVEIVGVGPTFYIPPSRFWVVPVVARWREPHPTEPNPWEVDAVLKVPLEVLLEPDRWRKVPLSHRGATWAWQLEDDLLWGATAIVMALLLQVAVNDWSGGVRPEELGDDRIVRPWEEAPAWTRRMRLAGELPSVPQADVPHVSAAQMREVDRRLAELGLGLASLVEQAGRAVAHAVRRLLDDDLSGHPVTVLAGSGGNGAGGLAAARLLATAGARVHVLLIGAPKLGSQVEALRWAGGEVDEVRDGGPGDVSPGDVVVDAMLGYGAQPPLRGRAKAVADWLQRYDVPVVALDLPSGLDATSGLNGVCVNADVTVTLGAPKTGLEPAIVHPYVGDLYLADLGVPRGIWSDLGIEFPDVFGHGPLVRLTVDEAATDAGTPDQGELPGA